MTKTQKIIYWVATLWLALGMVSTGIVQLLKKNGGAGGLDSVVQLGYPAYLLTFLGICKILGVVGILIPKYPLVKEWAYAGFFFLMSGAIFSHLVTGYSLQYLIPCFLLLVLTVVSWYLRPANRKMLPAIQ